MAAKKKKKKTRSQTRGCFFCQNKLEPDYKEINILKRFITDRGKIVPRSKTGTCRKHQKRVAVAVKRARHLSLLPFVVRVEK